MIKNRNISYMALNINDNIIKNIVWDNKATIIEECNKLQKEHYNIYFILNDFTFSRQVKDLLGFNFIGIDYDLPEDKRLITTEKGIVSKSQNLLWLTPNSINKTYKWFHIIYKLGIKLYDLEKKII